METLKWNKRKPGVVEKEFRQMRNLNLKPEKGFNKSQDQKSCGNDGQELSF